MATTPLPSTGAVSGLGETLAFFTQADFAQRRFETHGDVFETKLLAQRMVFIRGERAIGDLLTVHTPWRVMPNWPEKGLTRSIVRFQRCR